jgi:cell division protein FtsQ
VEMMDEENKDKQLTPWQIEREKYLHEKGEKASWEESDEEENSEEEVNLEEELKDKPKEDAEKSKEEAETEKEEVPEKEEERKSIAHELPQMKKSRNKKLKRRLAVITGISLFAILVMSYEISPLSKLANVEVNGANATDTQEIITGSKLEKNQNILEQFFNRGQFEKNIVESNIRVKTAKISWSGINNFHIQVTEYAIKGYEQEENQFFPILENGKILSEQPVTDEERNKELPLLLGFKGKSEQVSNLFVAFNRLPQDMQNKIVNVQLSPRESNPDLVRITMNDGNLVIVSIEDIVDKMEYYQSVASQMSEPGVIDMEVGITTFPKDMLDRPLEKIEDPNVSEDEDSADDEN